MSNRRISLIRPSQVFDSFFDEVFNTPSLIGGPSTNGLNTVFTDSMELDMYETDHNVIVEAKVPGFKADNMNIRVEDNMLIIEGTITDENEKKEDRKYHLKESRTHSIFRSIMLPSKVDADRAEAEFTDGIVKVTLPKMEEVKPKTIKVKTK